MVVACSPRGRVVRLFITALFLFCVGGLCYADTASAWPLWLDTGFVFGCMVAFVALTRGDRWI